MQLDRLAWRYVRRRGPILTALQLEDMHLFFSTTASKDEQISEADWLTQNISLPNVAEHLCNLCEVQLAQLTAVEPIGHLSQESFAFHCRDLTKCCFDFIS